MPSDPAPAALVATDVPEAGRLSTWVTRIIVYGGALTGIGLLAAAVGSGSAPRWWWVVGGLLTLVFGSLAAVWITFRLRHRSPEARHEALAGLAARRDETAKPLERTKIASQAVKHKKATLRDGIDATAVVEFLTSAQRANEFRHLVYLELEVSVPGQPPYIVATGEHLDPASAGSVAPGSELIVKVDPRDAQRVAVCWEQSLRRR